MRGLLALCALAAAKVPWLDAGTDAPERTPPAPEVYARQDATWRKSHETRGRPTALPKTASALDRLKLEQFQHATCHSQAHQLGREIFAEEAKKLDIAKVTAILLLHVPVLDASLDRALKVCEYRCTGGCLHGAVGAYAYEQKRRDPTYRPDIEALCRRDAMRAVVDKGECAHAVGHALALLQPEADALEGCAASPDYSVAQYCAGGVVMERGGAFFGQDRNVRSKCENVPPKTRAACYYFGLRSKASGARNRTLAVDETVRAVCTSGVTRKACVYGAATAFLKNKMHTAEGVQGARFCETMGEARWACLDGLMFRSAKFGSEALRRGACAVLRGDAAALCQAVAAAGMYSLRKGALVASYATV